MGVTRGGNLVILRLDDKGVALQTFQSQPLELEGEGFIRIGIHWSSDGIHCRFGPHDLISLHECASPVRVVFKELETFPVRSYNAQERYAACERETRRRAKRVHESGANDRVLSLSEEIENLRDGLRALAEDVQRVRAGEKHRTNAMRAGLRELISDLGESYRPLLQRVAGFLDLPLPIYAIPKGFLKTLGATHGFTTDSPSCTKIFETQQIVDLSEWLRRPMLAHPSRKHAFTFDEVIASSANFLGGAHSPAAVPPAIDEIARTTSAGISVNTQFLLRVAETIVELGRSVLRLVEVPEAARCTEHSVAEPVALL